MYTLRPTIEMNDFHEIKSPMYSMKNIHDSNNVESADTKDNKILQDVEFKQDKLLKQISEIKDLLAILKSELSKSKVTAVEKERKINQTKNFDFTKNGVIHEVVLNVSVKNPPLSLLVLNKLWPDVTFVFSGHVHSSIRGLPTNLKEFKNLNTCENVNGTGTQLRIRVVWKQVWSDCELIVSPLNSAPILGEVNFLRFLNNSLSPVEMDPFSLACFESKLDACHGLQHCDTIQQVQEYYANLSEGLENSNWLAGEEFTILDIACWSAISSMKNASLNSSLTKWLKKCNDYLSGTK